MADGETLNRTVSEPGTIRSSKRISNEKEVTYEPNIPQVEDEEASPPSAPAVTFTEGGWRGWSTIAGACVFLRVLCVPYRLGSEMHAAAASSCNSHASGTRGRFMER